MLTVMSNPRASRVLLLFKKRKHPFLILRCVRRIYR